MTNDEIAALRAAAGAATPGPWSARITSSLTASVAHAQGWVNAVDAVGDDEMRDAVYIAHANPATILRLLAHVESLRVDAEALHKAATRGVIALAHASEAHPLYRRDYEGLSEAIDVYRAALAAGEK